MPSRRQLLALVPLAGAAGLARAAAAAPAPAMLDPKDPAAGAQGYVPDAARVDRAKWPKYAPGQTCAGCALYQGAAGTASGPCPIYQGRLVAARGWCNVFVKRP
jgi:hypothetical protein